MNWQRNHSLAFCFDFPGRRCCFSSILVEHNCKFRMAEDIWERNLLDDFFVGSISRRFQQEIISRNLLQWTVKIETSSWVFVWVPECNFETVASRSTWSSKMQLMQVTLLHSKTVRDVFVDGENIIKWRDEFFNSWIDRQWGSMADVSIFTKNEDILCRLLSLVNDHLVLLIWWTEQIKQVIRKRAIRTAVQIQMTLKLERPVFSPIVSPGWSLQSS